MVLRYVLGPANMRRGRLPDQTYSVRADHMDASGGGAGRNAINRGAFFQAQNAPTQAKKDRSRSGWQAE